jgi:hypothetical protein
MSLDQLALDLGEAIGVALVFREISATASRVSAISR